MVGPCGLAGVGCFDARKDDHAHAVATHSQSTVNAWLSAMPRRVWRRCSRSLGHPQRHRSSGAAWAHLAAADALFLQVFAALNNSPEHARSTTDNEPAAPPTTKPSGPLPTDWSAFSRLPATPNALRREPRLAQR